MKKSRQKKTYNPLKSVQKDPSAIIKNTGIYQLPGGKAEFVNTETKNFLNYSKKEILKLGKVYGNAKFRWTVALIIFTLNEKGEKTLTVHHVSPNFECKADHIAQSVKVEHDKMHSKIDPKQFLAAGWLAVPREEYLSSVVLFDIFDKENVWYKYVTQPIDGYELGVDKTKR